MAGTGRSAIVGTGITDGAVLGVDSAVDSVANGWLGVSLAIVGETS